MHDTSQCSLGPSDDRSSMYEQLLDNDENHKSNLLDHQNFLGGSFLKLFCSFQHRQRDGDTIPDRLRGSYICVNLCKTCRGAMSVPIETVDKYEQLPNNEENHKSHMLPKQSLR